MVQAGKSPQEAKREICNEVIQNFEDFLADRQPGKPFCYWFGPTNAHRKWIQGSGKRLWGIAGKLCGCRVCALVACCLVIELRLDNPNGVGVLFSETKAGVAYLEHKGATLPEHTNLGAWNQTEGLEAGHKARGSGKFGNRGGVSLQTGC